MATTSEQSGSRRRVRQQWLQPLAPMCSAIAALLHPYAEVVAHDLRRGVIVGIWNPFSGRAVGDESLLDGLADLDSAETLGPYPKVAPDGRALTSMSAVIHNDDGAVGLICINFDRSPLEEAIAALTRLGEAVAPRPEPLFAVDWREQIALEVDAECRRRGLDRRRLTRGDRLALVRDLDEKGLFATRRAAEHAAATLEISRASVYSLLREVRG